MHLRNRIEILDLPAVLETHRRDSKNEAVNEEENRLKREMVETLQLQGLPNISSVTDLINTTISSPLNWIPTITRMTNQSDESFTEQTNTLKSVLNVINEYKSGIANFQKHQIISGPPGTGQSHKIRNNMAFAFSQGLKCIVTSLASERAAMFSGQHINHLIPFPVKKKFLLLSTLILRFMN